MSDAAKLVRGLLASGAAAIFIASIYEYLSLAGVVDSMNAARIVLIFAGLVGFSGVLVSEIVWGKSRKTIVLTAIGTAVGLSFALWKLDSWTVRYRIAHTVPAPTTTSQSDALPPIVSELVKEYEKAHPNRPRYGNDTYLPLDAEEWINERLRAKGQPNYIFVKRAVETQNCPTAMIIGPGVERLHINGAKVGLTCGQGIVISGTKDAEIKNYSFTQIPEKK